MKLSEAIRMGSQWADCYGPVFGEGDSCCAIGGVIRAIGKPMLVAADGETYSGMALRDEFPLLGLEVAYPGKYLSNERSGHQVASCIINLFEEDKWSKRAIAEWVSTIESKLEAASRLSSGVQDTEAVQVATPASSETVKV